MKLVLFTVVLALLSACGKVQQASNPQTETAKGLSYADHSRRDASIRKKYFLIAGGRDNANFAQEIIEQKRLFESLGVPKQEISCFYTIPFESEFQKDKKHYTELAEELRSCYPAYPKYVWEQIQDGGTNVDSMYLYVTSHGQAPFTEVMRNPRISEYGKRLYTKWITKFPGLDQYMVSLDALANGAPADLDARVDLLNSGEQLENLFFTPRLLKNAIRNGTHPATKKQVIVQSCFSGGFIDARDDKFKPDTLRDLENATLMSAARFDRSSFGCNSGSYRTYFGGAFNDVLMAKRVLPQHLNWPEVYSEVKTKVGQMEEKYFQAGKRGVASLPVFFTNREFVLLP